ncbi:MAG TPA: photosystem II reaction center protein PsbN [Allocoleopsis sp.]
MDSTTIFITTLGVIFLGFTGFAIYTAFGPPSKQLADPFDDHED